MKNPQDSGMNERERRRMKVNQQQQGVIQEKNDASKTNMVYKQIVEETNKNNREQTEKGSPTDDLDIDKMPLDMDKPSSVVPVGETKEEDGSDSEDGKGDAQKKDRPPFLIQETGELRKYWEVIIIFLALYNALVIPIQLFFDPNPNIIDNDAVRCTDALVDFLFLIDIIFEFRTTFLDKTLGQEELDAHRIAKRYASGRFAIDFVSSVPFNALFGLSTVYLDMLGLLKLLRITRISPVIRKSNAPAWFKVYLQMGRMFLMIIIALHVLCCMWHRIVGIEEQWVQNMDFMYVQQDRAYQSYWQDQEGDDTNFWRSYFVGLYTGFYLFGVGEVVPRETWIEFIIAFGLLAVCTIFNAVLIGYMASYAEELTKDSRAFQDKMNLTNTAMLNLGLQRELKTKITEYINNTHTTQKRQAELKEFMQKVSPQYRLKCQQQVFSTTTDENPVLSKLKIAFINSHLASNKKKIKSKGEAKYKDELEALAFHKLVVKLAIVLSMPEQILLRQEDAADDIPASTSGDGDEDKEQIREPRMYFIAKGRYDVFVKKSHMVAVANNSGQKVQRDRMLQEGDHFGEISLIYGCKRTSTVESTNYGTLAMLTRTNYYELQKSFETIVEMFKKQICLYDDEVKIFLEMACDKIDYFRTLTFMTKQEIIYSMERVTYEKEHLLCKKNDEADKMFVIQEGIVEVACSYAPKIEQPFVIERLGRGAIINHRSFMLRDEADTDFRCLTTVSCFVLHLDKLKAIKDKKQDMKKAFENVEVEILRPKFPLALDYIFHNNNEKDYDEQLRKNQLRVKLKNAIMQTWSQVKDTTKAPSMNELIDDILKKKEKSKGGQDFFSERKEAEQHEKKKARKQERDNDKAEQKVTESKDSYLTIPQYEFVSARIHQARKSLKDQQDVIDMMEKKMLKVITARKEKEVKGRSDDKFS